MSAPNDPADAAFARLDADPEPAPGTYWRHRKGGLYTIVARAVIESTLAPAVVYLDAKGRAWVRPLAEFMDGRFTPAEGTHEVTVEATGFSAAFAIDVAEGEPAQLAAGRAVAARYPWLMAGECRVTVRPSGA